MDNFVILIFVTWVITLATAQPTPNIMECNHNSILEHMGMFGHSYCSHTCAFFNDRTEAYPRLIRGTCEPSGNCYCACTGAADASTPGDGVDICPPNYGDAVVQLRCQEKCVSRCVGGEGKLCSETNVNVRATICTCFCPDSTCKNISTTTTRPTTTTMTTTSSTQLTTTTTVPPTTVSLSIIPQLDHFGLLLNWIIVFMNAILISIFAFIIYPILIFVLSFA